MTRTGRWITTQAALLDAYGPGRRIGIARARLLRRLTNRSEYRLEEFGLVKRFLADEFGSVFDAWAGHGPAGVIEPGYPVWVFWWQGEERAPAIVSACIRSMRNHAKGHEVRVVTERNVRDYANLPDHVYRRLADGRLTLTHFSDILRMDLLHRHGGLWMDATLFAAKDFFDGLAGLPLYSNRLVGREDHAYVSEYRWSGFFLAGGAGNPLFGCVRDVLLDYWRRRDFLVEFFLIDFAVAVARDRIPSVQAMLDDLAPNNPDIYTLAGMLGREYDQDAFEAITERTAIFKLTWKKRFEEQVDGRPTFYGRLIADTL